MLRRIRIKKSVKLVVSLIFAFSAVGFVQKKHQEKVCKRVIINIEQQFDNYFINDRDVMHLVTNGGSLKVIGTSFNELDLKEIEKRVKEHKFIREADVYKDLTGNLIIHAVQSLPVARVVQADGPDAYISTEGKVLPVSERFTARVLIIDGEYTRRLVEKDLYLYPEGKTLLNMLLYVDADKFWKAQIAEMSIDRNKNITLYPQVGKHQIEFGKAEDYERKFNKLRLFYKEILPEKGWNRYHRINLKFENQIVCE